ncbi:atlastin-1-like, partial [Anneissia japonica]|uniref:atlastin-1-like n=1 Tax=Anneissia japonica TaxID=1529436 RepID=UPI0014258EC3
MGFKERVQCCDQKGYVSGRFGGDNVRLIEDIVTDMDINQLDGALIGIILLDTQGTQDPKTPQKQNAAVFALSTLMSSVQVYNVKDYVNEADLQFLELFIRYGLAIKGDEKKPFETLLFLIRDWRGHREYPFGEDGGKKYLSEKCMAIDVGSQSEENIEVRKNIGEVFTSLKCYLMPAPGEKVIEGDPELKGVLEVSRGGKAKVSFHTSLTSPHSLQTRYATISLIYLTKIQLIDATMIIRELQQLKTEPIMMKVVDMITAANQPSDIADQISNNN